MGKGGSSDSISAEFWIESYSDTWTVHVSQSEGFCLMSNNSEGGTRYRFAHFGEALRYLRDTYIERMLPNRPAMPRVRLTALSLIECLQAHGYSISSGSYSELETGANLP